jgi:hypothetical protein
MEQARKSGERMAQARGMLNSGLSGQYSQKAAIDAALPIAQQDSGVRTTAGMAGYQGRIDAARANQDYGNQASTINLQSSNSSKLSSQEAQQKSALSGQEYGQQSKLSGQQAQQTERLQKQADDAKLVHDQEVLAIQNDHSMSFEEKRAALDLKAQQYDAAQRYKLALLNTRSSEELTALELESREKVAGWELSAGDTKAISSAIALSFDTFAQDLVRIQTDPDLKPEVKKQVLLDMQKQQKAYLDSLEQIWGIDIELKW